MCQYDSLPHGTTQINILHRHQTSTVHTSPHAWACPYSVSSMSENVRQYSRKVASSSNDSSLHLDSLVLAPSAASFHRGADQTGLNSSVQSLQKH